MTTDKKESEKPIEPLENNNWLNSHDLNELIETTKLEILPKYDLIKPDDLITSRKVKILSLPVSKYIEKDGKKLNLTFITISDNDIAYSLPFNSIALQRSLLSLAIEKSKADIKENIDLSVVLNVLIGIKREQFTAKGFTQSPYKFYNLDK